MLARHIATGLFVFGLLGIVGAAFAQDDARQEKDKSFLGRLDSLGKTLFGGILPAEKPKAKEAAAPKIEPRSAIQKPSMTAKPAALNSSAREASARETAALRESAGDIDAPTISTRRAGSVLAGLPGSTSGSQSRAVPVDASDDMEELMPENTPPAVPRSVDGLPKRVRRPMVAETPSADDSATPETTEQEFSTEPTHQVTKSSPVESPEPTERPMSPKTTAKPLHERLSTFRQSAFAAGGVVESHPQSNPTSEQAAEASVKPMERETVAERVRIPLHVAETMAADAPQEAEAAPLRIETAPAAAEQMPAVVEAATNAIEQAPAVAPSNDDGVLFARKSAVLSVETLGPRRISVGKESTYEVSLTNSGEVAAEALVVYVSLPEWAEVVAADVSSGDAQVDAGQTAGAVQWTLGRLDAKRHEQLTLKIVPRQNRPFDLAVRWESKPVGSQAMIEVQQPKLALQLEGPREVLYGKKEVYRLRLANTGNGAAENVAIMLMPIGGGENVPATHRLGVLDAGDEKVLDVELTARQAGNLTIQLDARADGGVNAELSEKVIVRRASLKVEIEGPTMQFLGNAATYTIRVRNSGTAPAHNVNLSAVLPAGTKYLSGIENANLDAASGKLDWAVETINPEVEQSFVLKCNLAAAGVCRVQVHATADDDLSASASTITRVESVANLTMEVKDPSGPVLVGDEATYEVRVRNRGTRAAEGVEVFGYFSRGIEPTAAEGGPNRLGSGQVIFQPIASLAPGAEVVLQVHAKADASGNHVFRAEAHCKPLGTRLIREATNLYYSETSGNQQLAKEPATEAPIRDAMRPVTQPLPGETMPAPSRKQ